MCCKPMLVVVAVMQETVDDLKVQLHQQQQAASTAVQDLSAKEAELQKFKDISSTEAQGWQSKLEELKAVRTIPPKPTATHAC
jgi:hypothetical protein